MAYGVQDRLLIQLNINGQTVPLDSPNAIDVLHIVESARIYVPMLTLVIRDVSKFFTKKNLLVDGSLLEVTVDFDKTRSVYAFRLFSCKEMPVQGTTTYHIQGYLDVPKFWVESPSTPVNGSVSAALQKICASTGLTYEGITTADSQLWVPNNSRYCELARRISEHAWVSDNSCCQMAVTTAKKMRLKDVSKMAQVDPIQLFSNKDNSKEQQVISDFKVLNKSGFFNGATGYRQTKVVQSTLRGRTEVHKDLTLTKNSAKLMMNDAIHSDIAQGNVVFSPIDFGNVSETNEKALYQNRRLSNLFAFGLEFVTPRQVKAQLLDTVNCELAKADIDGVEAYNGKYLLVSKVLYVQGINAVYKCEVYRHGLNTNQENTQA